MVVHADPGSPAIIGAGVSVGHGAVIHGCRIEDGCLIGMNATVLNRAVIGAESLVAAGSVVLEGTVIPPRSLVAGRAGEGAPPAQRRRGRGDEGQRRHLRRARGEVRRPGVVGQGVPGVRPRGGRHRGYAWTQWGDASITPPGAALVAALVLAACTGRHPDPVPTPAAYPGRHVGAHPRVRRRAARVPRLRSPHPRRWPLDPRRHDARRIRSAEQAELAYGWDPRPRPTGSSSPTRRASAAPGTPADAAARR